MSDGIIFVYGAVVSVVVIAGYAALFWAAIEDGRAQEETNRRAAARSAAAESE